MFLRAVDKSKMWQSQRILVQTMTYTKHVTEISAEETENLRRRKHEICGRDCDPPQINAWSSYQLHIFPHAGSPGQLCATVAGWFMRLFVSFSRLLRENLALKRGRDVVKYSRSGRSAEILTCPGHRNPRSRTGSNWFPSKGHVWTILEAW